MKKIQIEKLDCPQCESPKSVVNQGDGPICLVCGWPIKKQIASCHSILDDASGSWSNGIRILEDGK